MMHESSNVMMHALMQGDQVQFKFKFTKIGLSIEFLTKTPKFEKPLVQFVIN